MLFSPLSLLSFFCFSISDPIPFHSANPTGIQTSNMDTDLGFQEPVNNSHDTKVFDCNICLNLAQNPILTLCGHLFCWPCLYKWLSNSHECPVCKSLVKHDNLVPIYGRGTSRSHLPTPGHPSPTDEIIPSRPASHRPQTAPEPDLAYFRQDGSGNVTRMARIGVVSALLNFRDFRDPDAYGTSRGSPYVLSSYAHGGYAHGFHHHYSIHVEWSKLIFLKMCFLIICFLVVGMVILSFLFWS